MVGTRVAERRPSLRSRTGVSPDSKKMAVDHRRLEPYRLGPTERLVGLCVFDVQTSRYRHDGALPGTEHHRHRGLVKNPLCVSELGPVGCQGQLHHHARRDLCPTRTLKLQPTVVQYIAPQTR